MKKKPTSDQLWDVYFLLIGIVSLIICISLLFPGMLSAKSTMTSIGGLLLLFAVMLPLLLVFLSKLIVAVQKVIETKKRGKKNEESSIWN